MDRKQGTKQKQGKSIHSMAEAAEAVEAVEVPVTCFDYITTRVLNS